MEIQLNGDNLDIENVSSLADLLVYLKLQDKRVAIEHNGTVIPRSEHASRPIHAGDRIEIIHAIGGG